MRFAGTQLTNFFDPSNFDAVGKSSIMGGAKENMASMQSKALIDKSEIAADAMIEAAKYGADATRAQGAAQGQSSMFSGLGSMASGIAGGFASRPTPTVPTPTIQQAKDAGTFFAQSYINR